MSQLQDANPDLLYAGTTTFSEGSVVHRYFCEVSDAQFGEIKLMSEGQRLGWFSLDEALAMIDTGAYSSYFAAYLKEFAGDIRKFLNGDRNVLETHTTLQVDVRLLP